MPHYKQSYFAQPPDSPPKQKGAEFPEFGRELKNYRLAHDISQYQLAHWVGVDSGTISRVENGFRNPGRALVEAIVLELEMSPHAANIMRMKAGYAPK